jgi:uncharacterized protein YegL
MIRLPQALDFIARQKAPGPLTVYVPANPLYLATDSDRPFSFSEGRYPSPGHLLASREETPFSLQGRSNQLQDVVVYFNYLSERVFTGDRHRTIIETFWQAFIEGQGGTLARFDASLKDFFGTKVTATREKIPVNPQDRDVGMLVVPPARIAEQATVRPPADTISPHVAATVKKWNEVFEGLGREKNVCELARQLEQARAAVEPDYQPTNWCAQHVEAMVACADTMTDSKARRAKLEVALALAGACAYANEVPALKLRLLEADEKAETDRALTELTSLLKAGDAIPGGTDVSSLSNKLTVYLKAVSAAKAHDLPTTEVEPRIKSVQQQLDRLLVPIMLSPGCHAEITRVSQTESPFVFIDAFVTAPSGEPLRGLERKDFQIICDGIPARAYQVESVKNDPPLFQVVLCLDESLSMRGKPIAATKEAVKSMLADLAHNDRLSVLVLGFSDKQARVLCPWTNDKMRAASVIDALKPNGETALYDAIVTAAEALKQRDGERRLVLFTDGRDNASRCGLKPTELAQQLRAAGIETYAIGLRGADLDVSTMRRLSDQYLEASSLDQLRSAFGNTGEYLVREVYKFVITPDQSSDTAPRSFRVKVGGVNAVVAEGFARMP